MTILTEDQFNLYVDTRWSEDLTRDGDTVTATIIPAMIAAAEAQVKNALARSYSTAQLEGDEDIQRMTAHIALYNLMARRGPVPREVRNLYNDARASLEALKNGTETLSGVGQILPRRTSDSDDVRVFEQSDLFSGLPDLDEYGETT